MTCPDPILVLARHANEGGVTHSARDGCRWPKRHADDRIARDTAALGRRNREATRDREQHLGRCIRDGACHGLTVAWMSSSDAEMFSLYTVA
jgi:hypothetical protein